MATNLDIITDAYHLSGLIEEPQTPSAVEARAALKYMNGMILQWASEDIKLGFFSQTNVQDTIPIPETAEWAVKANLGVMLAASRGLEPPLSTKVFAQEAYEAVLRTAIADSLEPADMSHLPQGTGWTQDRYDIDNDTY